MQLSVFIIVFGLFSVAVAVSTHLCVICRHFCCHCFKAMSLVGIYLNKALQQPSWFQMHQVQCGDEYQIQLEVGDGLEGGKKNSSLLLHPQLLIIIMYNNIQYLQNANSQWSKSTLHNKNNNKILNLQNYIVIL